jgi:hypothetical protein
MGRVITYNKNLGNQFYGIYLVTKDLPLLVRYYSSCWIKSEKKTDKTPLSWKLHSNWGKGRLNVNVRYA